MGDIFEQIDEELEADKFQKYWEENRRLIIGLFVLFFTALFAYVGWQEWRQKQDFAAADRYATAFEAYLADGAENRETALQELAALSQESADHGYGRLGGLLQARLLADGGKPTEALAVLERLATVDGGDSPIANLALLNAAYLVSDDANQVKFYTGRITPNSVFQAHALELEGLILLREGDAKGALELFKQAAERNAEGAIAVRLNRRIERLSGLPKPPAVAPPEAAAAPGADVAPPAPTTP